MMLYGLNDQREGYDAIRALKIPNSVPPAYVFHPMPAGAELPGLAVAMPGFDDVVVPVPDVPANLEDLAFATIVELGALLRTRKINSLALTKMYMARLKRYDPKLHFVISLTEERALAQAKAADAEIAAANTAARSMASPGVRKICLPSKAIPPPGARAASSINPSTRTQPVVQRLDAAGAVLVAKFSLGALAMGYKRFGGRTRNPWIS